MTEQNCTSVATGDWDDGSTWSTGSPPQAAEHDIIADTHDVTIDTSSSVKSLTVNNGGKLIGNSSYTITITAEGTASYGTNGYAIRMHSGSELGTNVNLICNTNDSTLLFLNPSTGMLHNFEVAHPNTIAYLQGNCNLAGNLTVTSGRFDTDANYALTVTGDISNSGTLQGNASAISSRKLISTGTLNGGNFTVTGAGLGNTTRTIDLGGTVTGNVDITLTGAGNNRHEDLQASGNIRNLTINNAAAVIHTGRNTTIGGDLTITAGTLSTDDSGTSVDLTVTGDIHIDGTLTGNASTISGRSVHIDGTFTHDGALTCTGIASTNYAFQNLGTWTPGTSQTTTFSGDGATTYHVKSNDWNNVILNAAGENYYFRPKTGTAIAFAGYITVTDGNFYQNSAGDTWTVTGHVTINGGSLGLSTPATGTLTFKSLTIGGSGIFRAPNGLTEITGEADTGYAVDNSGTFTANGGTLEVGYASNSFIKLGSSVNNLTIRAENSVVKWVDNTTIAGDVVVTEGVFQPFNNSFTIAVTGDVTIQDGGTLGVTDSAQAYSFGSLTIEDGGEFIATSVVTTITGEGTYWALDVVQGGTFTHNSGTVTITRDSNTLIRGMEGDDTSGAGANALNNLIVNLGADSYRLEMDYLASDDSCVIAGDLTITRGKFYPRSTDDDGNSFTVTGDVLVSADGLYGIASRTGADSFGSLIIASGGEFIATSGTTTITNNSASGGYAIDNAGTFTHNNGTVTYVGPTDEHGVLRGLTSSHPLKNLILNNAGSVYLKMSGALEIEGDFTLTDGKFSTEGQSPLDIVGDVSLANGTTFEGGDTTVSHGSLTIASGGTYSASSGTTTITGTFDNNGTDPTTSFVHNDGTVTMGGVNTILRGGTASTGTHFYNLTQDGTGYVDGYEKYTVENTLTTKAGVSYYMNGDNYIYIGKAGVRAGLFDINGAMNFTTNDECYIEGAGGETLPALIDYDGTHSGVSGTDALFHLKNINWDGALVLGSSNIKLDGDCEFDALTVSSGCTIAVDTHELKFSGAFDGDGTVTVSTGQIVGTSNDYRPAVTTITDNAYIQAGDQLGSAFTITASKYPVLKGKRLYTGGGVDFSSSDFRNSSIIINGTETNYLVGDNFNNILVNNASGIETQLGGARTIKGSLRVGGIGKFDTQNNTLDIEGDIRQMKGSTLEFGNSTVRCTGSANFIGGFIGDSLLTFDGTDDKCSSTAAAANFTAIDSSNNFTCEGWIKASSASNYEHILSRGTSWGTGNITVYMNSAGNIQASLNADGSSTNTLTSDSSGLADNRWHHFAYTYDQTNLKLYINGRLEASAAFTTAISASSTGFELGTRGGTTNTWFGGEMARISIWSSALTAVQIRKMMFENFATATTTNCLAWWQMDERFGGTLDDEVGSVDLTISDTAMWNSPEGSFDDGGSTFTMKGNNTYLWFSPDQTFYNLGLAPSSKTTNISGRSNNNAIKVANTLTLGGGTLTQTPQSVELHLDSTGTPITQDATTSLAQIYRTMFNGAGATITAGTYDFIYPNAANQKLGGNVTGSSCLVSNNASLDLNTKQLSLSTKFELNDNSTLTLNNGAELLFTGGSSEFDSNATSILSAGPSAIINGVSTKSTFKSQNNFSVVGNVANLNVTNEELKVTGMVTNCTGFIHQMNPSQDADQQLDKDTADDRDTQFASLDMDRNTELVG